MKIVLDSSAHLVLAGVMVVAAFAVVALAGGDVQDSAALQRWVDVV